MFDILNYLAVDGVEDAPIGTPEGSVESQEPQESTNTTEVSNEPQEQAESNTDVLNEIEIDGEKYTLDQIKSFKQNSITAQEYLSMREEIQKERDMNKDAFELFNYLKSKPELTQKLYEFDSTLEQNMKSNSVNSETENRIQELEIKIRRDEIERSLQSITSKDKDVNEIELLKVATENNVSIEQAYNIWRGQNFDKILEKRLNETKKTMSDSLKKNNEVTKTIISNGDKKNDTSATFGLTDLELKFASKVGMTPEEYAKYKA